MTEYYTANGPMKFLLRVDQNPLEHSQESAKVSGFAPLFPYVYFDLIPLLYLEDDDEDVVSPKNQSRVRITDIDLKEYRITVWVSEGEHSMTFRYDPDALNAKGLEVEGARWTAADKSMLKKADWIPLFCLK